MEARLPADKLARARSLVATHLNNSSISYSELQSLVGFLSFAARVIIPGRAFLRRLFNSLKTYIPYYYITTDIRANLQWWYTFLNYQNGVSLLRHVTARKASYIQIDVSGTLGIGGYLLDDPEDPPQCDRVFSSYIPSRHRVKDIQFKEILAVLTAIRRQLPRLASSRLILYYNNEAVVQGLRKSSIRGQLIALLRQIVILLATYNIYLQVVQILIK